MASNNSRDYGYSSEDVAGYYMCARLCSNCKNTTYDKWERYPKLQCTVSKDGVSILRKIGEVICNSFESRHETKEKEAQNMNNCEDVCDRDDSSCSCHHPNVSVPCFYCESLDKTYRVQRNYRNQGFRRRLILSKFAS